MIKIDSDQGHIGPFWWINADPSKKLYGKSVVRGLRAIYIQWGCFGFGRDITTIGEKMNLAIERIALEQLDD